VAERNDQRFIEDSSVAFAMYADEHGLTLEEGRELAERVGEQLEGSADDRQAYLGAVG